MANVTLLHYNNYFNRIVKKLDTVSEYKAADTTPGTPSVPHYLDISSINFVPGDGVETSLILGTSALEMDYDYLLVTHTDTTSTPNVELIDSRWFIVEEHRTRDGQYEVGLRRDVIVDNYATVENCTAYVEKGTLQPGSPLLYNKEGLAVNQIKQEEILLKDKTQVPWIVGYIAKNAAVNTPITINYNPANHDYIELSAQTIEDWSYYPYSTNKYYGTVSVSQYRINWQAGTDDNWHYGHFMTRFDNYGNMTCDRITNDDWSYVLRSTNTSNSAMTTVSNALTTAWNNIGANVFNQAVQEHFDAHNASLVAEFLGYNGKIVKTQDGKYYEIRIFSVSGLNLNNSTIPNFNSSSPLFTRIKQAVVNSGSFSSSYNTPNTASVFLTASAPAYSMSYEEIEGKTVKAKVSENRRKTSDAQYDIICLPYGDLNVYDRSDNSLLLTTNREVSMAAINALITSAGMSGDATYDVQLLPYCPLQDSISPTNGLFTIDTSTSGVSFDYIVDESTTPNTNVGIICYVPQSSFTFNIPQEIDYNRFEFITGFEPIPTQSQSGPSNLQRGVEYAFETFNTTLTDIQLDSMGEYNITTVVNSTLISGIRLKKINKTTGKVISDYMCNSIKVQLNTGNVGNYFTSWILNRGVPELEETITNDEYEDANYYITWTLVANSWGGRGTGNVFPDLARQVVVDSAITDTYAIKLDNETKLYRLVSPNYQGEFEFSVAKNLGVDEFNVDCTYKPYNPYIHVNPNFKNLYGQDFNDSRGLICNGDFSFGMVSNAFATYELQNKNYQAIFDRQIQNMDVNHAIARNEAGWQVAAGTVQGASGGALAGAMMGGAYGAVGGAIVGGTTSLLGGIADLQNLGKHQAEEKSFAADMYNLSLQNVKALPNSMTKCTALTYNNKLFPFVEIYGCTTEEEEAFIEKIKYDGMTVDVIGRLGDYKGGMLRGEVIRFASDDAVPLKADAHMANAIYTEIKKGVYM